MPPQICLERAKIRRASGAHSRAKSVASSNSSSSQPLFVPRRGTKQKQAHVLPAVALPQSAQSDNAVKMESLPRRMQAICGRMQTYTSEDSMPQENQDIKVEKTTQEVQEDFQVEKTIHDVGDAADGEKTTKKVQEGMKVEKTSEEAQEVVQVENKIEEIQEVKLRRPCELAMAVRSSTSNEFDWLLRQALPSGHDHAEMQMMCNSNCAGEPVESKLETEARSGIFPVDGADYVSRVWSAELDNSRCGTTKSSFKGADQSVGTIDEFWKRYENEGMRHRRPAWCRDDPQEEAAHKISFARRQDARRAKLQRLIGMRHFTAAAREALGPADGHHDKRGISRQSTSECTSGNPFGVRQPKRSEALVSLDIMSARRRELSEARRTLEEVLRPRGGRDEFRSELGSMFSRLCTQPFGL